MEKEIRLSKATQTGLYAAIIFVLIGLAILFNSMSGSLFDLAGKATQTTVMCGEEQCSEGHACLYDSCVVICTNNNGCLDGYECYAGSCELISSEGDTQSQTYTDGTEGESESTTAGVDPNQSDGTGDGSTDGSGDNQPECELDIDCGEKMLCVDNVCIEDTACYSDEDCSEGVCLTSSGECVGCLSDQNCPIYPVMTYCVVAENSCQQGCRSDLDCEEGEVCNEHVCEDEELGCVTAADCAENETCENSVCVAANLGCITNDECADGELCIDAVCIVGDCVDDLDCSDGETCNNNLCETETLDCITAVDCLGDEICENNICVAANLGCTTNGDCIGGVCINAACIVGDCVTDLDCSDGETCEDNLCTVASNSNNNNDPDACASNDECEEGYFCESQTCTEGCKTDEECGENKQCTVGVCEELTGCLSDFECSAGIDMTCVISGGETFGSCVIKSCLDDADCDEKTCVDDECTGTVSSDDVPTEGASCTVATQVVDCANGLGCDEATSACKTTCSGDADCKTGFYCYSGECFLDGDCFGSDLSPDPTMCADGFVCGEWDMVCGECSDDVICENPLFECFEGICVSDDYFGDDDDDDSDYGDDDDDDYDFGAGDDYDLGADDDLGEGYDLGDDYDLGLGNDLGDDYDLGTGDDLGDDSETGDPQIKSVTTGTQAKTKTVLTSQQLASGKKSSTFEKSGIVGQATESAQIDRKKASPVKYLLSFVVFMIIAAFATILVVMHRHETMHEAKLNQQQTMQNKTPNVSGEKPNMEQVPQQQMQIDPNIEQQFVTYIDTQVMAGQNQEVIINQLLGAGWNKEILNSLAEKYAAKFLTQNQREQILGYIRYYAAKGFPKDSIITGLINAGWKKELIEELMKENNVN
ncbi:hypothetical protein HOL83_02090 [Candidatus Woesearchaeota archaeon]|nr:hypothetical protein [Candidatus Woesearchaeota archaeon]MBT6336167.1 hypothetical protein [Candidatus Woesearchaeota archaeon]